MWPSANWLRQQWRIVPDRVTVAYRAQTSLGVYAADADVAEAWWRAGSTEEVVPSRGVALASRRTWFFPKSKYGGVPAVGDLLVSSVSAIDPVAATWTLLGVDHAGAFGAWSLKAVSLQLAANLRDSGTLSRPAPASGAGGKRVPNLTTLVGGIPCRVQPMTGGVREVANGRVMVGTYLGLLGVQVVPQFGDVFGVGATRYTVTDWQDADRLDDFFKLGLELLP